MPRGVYARPSLEDRFWAKVDKTESCWLWTAFTNRDGYGLFSDGRRTNQAHRYSYELLVGPIPQGLTVDHVKSRGCVSRNCVNPAHLEPVTNRENLMRGIGLAALNVIKQECPQGHPYDERNTYVHRGQRLCRECRRTQSRLAQRRRRANVTPTTEKPK
jgi:hypothetical protein